MKHDPNIRPATETVYLVGPEQRQRAISLLQNAMDGSRVIITSAKESRTSQQNRTLHMWFGEVARHQADLDASEVKGMCHRRWGLAIKLRCPQFAWVWERAGARLSYEQQCNLLASGVLNVSSSMSVEELSEYMDAMSRHFRSDGVNLTDPELRKYEGS